MIKLYSFCLAALRYRWWRCAVWAAFSCGRQWRETQCTRVWFRNCTALPFLLSFETTKLQGSDTWRQCCPVKLASLKLWVFPVASFMHWAIWHLNPLCLSVRFPFLCFFPRQRDTNITYCPGHGQKWSAKHVLVGLMRIHIITLHCNLISPNRAHL